MSVPPPEHEAFKLRLRAEMDRQGLSIRALGRRLNSHNPEAGRRTLHRWLSSSSTHMPSLASRKALARALGVPEDFFAPQIGADEMLDVAREYARAELYEELLRRARWCGNGVPFGGYYLTAEQRELVGA